MSDDNRNDGFIPKGTLVTLMGLQSEAGKKLNGSQGLILGKPTVGDGVTRYPVLIWADKQRNILTDYTNKKKLKHENLQVQAFPEGNTLFETAAQTYAQVANQLRNDSKQAMFWMEQLHKIWPETFQYGATYANILREYCHEPQQASKVIEKYIGKIPESDPAFGQFCSDVCVTFADAGYQLEDALEHALKIPTTNNEDKERAIFALQTFIRQCIQRVARDTSLSDEARESINGLLLRAANTLGELDPRNAESLMAVAGANCHTENFIEGVKWYRRALKLPNIAPGNLRELKINTSMAQLQCPGMKMHNYIATSMMGRTAICYHKDDHKTIKMQTIGNNQMMVIPAATSGVQMVHIEVPEDPDDPKHFSEEFLSQFK